MKIILKKTSWFTVTTILCLAIITLFSISGCNKSDIPTEVSNDVSFTQGNWIWMKTYTTKFGMIDNEFKSIFTILNQDEDNFNYKVTVEDTLYRKGNFQLQYDQWNNRMANIELPHYNLGDNWLIIFMDMEGKPSEDTFYFFSGNPDDYMYYYQKIK